MSGKDWFILAIVIVEIVAAATIMYLVFKQVLDWPSIERGRFDF